MPMYLKPLFHYSFFSVASLQRCNDKAAVMSTNSVLFSIVCNVYRPVLLLSTRGPSSVFCWSQQQYSPSFPPSPPPHPHCTTFTRVNTLKSSVSQTTDSTSLFRWSCQCAKCRHRWMMLSRPRCHFSLGRSAVDWQVRCIPGPSRNAHESTVA